MKVFTLIFTVAISGLYGRSFAAESAASGDQTVQSRLLGDLLCKSTGDEHRKIVANGNDFKSGIAVFEMGEELDYISGVVLREPIKLQNAKTNIVTWSVGASHHYNFHAILFSEFVGDYRAVVRKLQLIETKANTRGSGVTYEAEVYEYAKFVSAKSATSDNQCPPTIMLTPTTDGKFLLGCGWCNGG